MGDEAEIRSTGASTRGEGPAAVPCPSESTILLLLEDGLTDAEVRATHLHFDTCRACRALFSALARAETPLAGPSGDGNVSLAEAAASPCTMAPGTRIGRFIIDRFLGAGGMGVVLAAEDPALGRKVALKLVHAHHREGPGSEQWVARLSREARAIARLSHPNVITVHDIGVHGDQMFVAMELVEGDTLRSWLAESPRSWRDVVAVLIAAGSGLSEAHRAGLVHRDFKPDNVLIGHDGEIRVTDFGLACPLAGADGSLDVDAAALDASAAALVGGQRRLTCTGLLVGTPGYIAPEVLRGGSADAASDQFSFCVTLYEALYRERPFPRSSDSERGDVQSRPPEVRIARTLRNPHRAPGWLQQIVQRGLSWCPEDRFPSMDSLLAALSREPIRRRRIQWSIAASMLVAGGVTASVLAASEPEHEPCTGAIAQVSAIWNPSVSVLVQSSFAATDRPYARSTGDRVAQRLDTYTRQWADLHRATCLATVRGEQSPDLLDRRLLCLNRRLGRVGALVDLFVRRADDDLVDRAIDLVGDLEPLPACAESAALLSQIAPVADPWRRAHVGVLERQADRAELERRAGRPEAAANAARAVLDAERALQYAPLAAFAGGVLGRSLEDLGRPAEAREALVRAQRHAEAAGDIRLSVHLMLDLLIVVGVRQEHDGEAQLLGQLAEAALERPELRDDQEMRARLLSALGNVATQEKRADRAIELQREVLAIRRRALPLVSEDVASAEERLGVALRDKIRQAEARVHYRRALAIRRQLYGDEHPLIATIYINLGVSYLDEADTLEARSHLLAALAILERLPTYRSYPIVLSNLGHVENSAGNYEQSRRYHEAALAVRLAKLGENHPSVAISLDAIGDVLRNLGDSAKALQTHRRALAIFEHSVGADHPRYANCLADIGEDLRRLGRAAESLPHQERALQIMNARSPDLDAQALLYQGLAFLDLGHAPKAIAVLTRAHGKISPGEPERARAAFGLARALEPNRPTSPRATALAQEALATFTAIRATREQRYVAAYLARGSGRQQTQNAVGDGR